MLGEERVQSELCKTEESYIKILMGGSRGEGKVEDVRKNEKIMMLLSRGKGGF